MRVNHVDVQGLNKRKLLQEKHFFIVDDSLDHYSEILGFAV